MTYTAIYLPSDEPIETGDSVMDSAGDVTAWKEEWNYELHAGMKSRYKKAILSLVRYEFNQMIVLGPVYPSITWLQQGDVVKDAEWVHLYRVIRKDAVEIPPYTVDADTLEKAVNLEVISDLGEYWHVKCPHCGTMH